MTRATVELCGRADVVAFLECRGIPEDVATLPDSHEYYANMFPLPEGSHFNTRRRGVLVGVRRTVVASMASCRHDVIAQGRASRVVLESRIGQKLCIIVVHADPGLMASAQRGILRLLRRTVDEDMRMPTILAGDWSFIGDGDGRLRKAALGQGRPGTHF